MIDFMLVAGFEWDAGNARKNEQHGVMQSEAEQVFFDPKLLTAPDPRHSANETRFHALGSTHEGRLLHITFTLRVHRTLIRVISARNMSRRERKVYESQD
jgi:uncharacterized protein